MDYPLTVILVMGVASGLIIAILAFVGYLLNDMILIAFSGIVALYVIIAVLRVIRLDRATTLD